VTETNVLYYGDNLDILRRYIPDAAVDLIYLDPPFNSNRAYSVIFKDESGRGSDAQIEAFDDTWHWGPRVESTYQYLTNFSRHQGAVSTEVSALVGALRKAIGTNQMMAYLVEMTVRLAELHRVLKPTGSLWLHCDPTASHYLKIVLDSIFGPDNFLNEVIWKRWSAHGNAGRIGNIHDVLLLYGRTTGAKFNKVYTPHDDTYVEARFRFADPGGRRWMEQNLANPAVRPNLMYDYQASNGIIYKSPPNGWKYTLDRMQRLDREGRLYFPSKVGGRLRLKVYLDELSGALLQDVWTDIYGVGGSGAERLGYPTQKPLPLLERIISISSNPGDIVLDPFCGCGTALIAAQKLGRRWLGIDITYLSIAVMESRLVRSFPELGHTKVIGQPTEVEGARMLAEQSLHDRYEFQYWALTQIGAQPVGDKKKGADAGIDGRIAFTEAGNDVKFVLVSVKSGGVNVAMVRDLVGTMKREDAPLGLFVTLDEPSGPMKVEAAGAGTYWSELANRDYPRVQIVTVKDLLEGRRPTLPLLVLPTFQQAERVHVAPGQEEMFGS